LDENAYFFVERRNFAVRPQKKWEIFLSGLEGKFGGFGTKKA